MSSPSFQWLLHRDPAPRAVSDRYTPFAWSVQSFYPLPPAEPVAEEPLDRRSVRALGSLSNRALSNVLWATSRVQETLDSCLGFVTSLRPVPSAGAIHPIHVLVARPGHAPIERYDPYRHGLQQLAGGAVAANAHRQAQTVLAAPDAVLLLLVAEPGMTAAKYADSESLVWRDAGVLLGGLAGASAAHGVGFCALGVTGAGYLGQLVEQTQLRAVGCAWLGTPQIAVL